MRAVIYYAHFHLASASRSKMIHTVTSIHAHFQRGRLLESADIYAFRQPPKFPHRFHIAAAA